ncbi:chondroadherin-like protein isoform X2 [Acanthaster planci]|uniref:Chondroadherin-like protein isoform X2 n=1 Tax=Acanthaster planci TaxID=133434 RepID=A0A8B7ZWW6_ACAPL|nr:chondroadherin-like protein isoform X2 [Acanthaster planci]
MDTRLGVSTVLFLLCPGIAFLQPVDPSYQCSALCEYTEWALDADCRNRDLTSIPVQCSDVETLDLRHNQIRVLPSGALEGFSNLRYLDIEMMELETIMPGAFKDNVNLLHIYVQINHLTVIQSFTFKGAPNLKQLFLNSNKIRILDPRAFAGIPQLETLFLSDNNISDISSDLFRNLTKLRYLYLENNHLSTVPEGAFAGQSNLRHLSLAGNKLTHIPNVLFEGLKHLRALKLSYNQIISVSPLPTLPRLSHVDLYNNQLTSVTNLTSILKVSKRLRRSNWTKKFTTVFLAKNPLNCDCEMEPLRIWMQVYQEEIGKHHRANATCAFPAELTDVSLCHQQAPFCPIQTSTQSSMDHAKTVTLTRLHTQPVDISENTPLTAITIIVVCISSVVLLVLVIWTVYMKCTGGLIPHTQHNSKEGYSRSPNSDPVNITQNPTYGRGK